ncbi:MAG: molybdopterin-dependent oxidoreductase [Acidobacteriota bacterium]
MEIQRMSDTYSNPRRHLLRREAPHQTSQKGVRAANVHDAVSPRTWPDRGTNINLDDFELSVFGAVRKPLALDWKAITELPTQSVKADLDARSIHRPRRTWHGASLQYLLREANVEPSAIRVTLFSDGGYFTRYGLHELIRDGGVLAYEVDGQPLSRSDGGPLRLVLPRVDPWRCAKWVRGLAVEDESAF